MKLGFTQVYNEKNWIGYAIDQATRICDKLLIVEGARFLDFNDLPARSDDGTLDVINDKMRAYPNFIEVWPDGCDTGNQKKNFCANHQIALERCKTGDYFITFDNDTFFTDSCIDTMNEAMKEGKLDSMELTGLQFLLGFKWVFAEHTKEAFFKKILGSHFIRLQTPKRFGSCRIKIEGISFLHYCWVKTYERMLRRARIANYKEGMKKWIERNYNKIKLAEGETLHFIRGQAFTLRKYKGSHPSVLDDHPWRYVGDIRKI